MDFVDQAKLLCSAGDGGNGCVAFRREKYIPLGGPNGGDGGNGGSVILRVTSQTNSLAAIHRLRSVKAEKGQNGLGSQKTGRSGSDHIVSVPIGTCVYDSDHPDAPIIADLCEMGQEVVVARGGQGGLGNMRFKSSTNRAPRQVKPGESGEEIRLRLELRVMADIGLLGLPNAGKSSLLRKVSAATPKVANYAFTTVKPHVGVVHYQQYDSFVMADIPGLIAGAAEGHGMGDRFLKHLKRCRVLLHLIDVTQDIEEQLHVIENEITAYGEGLSEKPRYIVLNKIDSIDKDALMQKKQALEQSGYNVHMISALVGTGCDDLVAFLWHSLSEEE